MSDSTNKVSNSSSRRKRLTPIPFTKEDDRLLCLTWLEYHDDSEGELWGSIDTMGEESA